MSDALRTQTTTGHRPQWVGLYIGGRVGWVSVMQGSQRRPLTDEQMDENRRIIAEARARACKPVTVKDGV